MIVNGLLWKRTEIILSVSEIASKYCISDSFVDYDVYSISYSLAGRMPGA